MTERTFPDMEIESSLEGDGGWLSWIGNGIEALPALRWKSAQGDEIPEDLVELRDVLVSFRLPPHDAAIQRVLGLEKAFREISEDLLPHLGYGNTAHCQRLEHIVKSCVKYSGHFDIAEPEEESDGK